MKTLVPVDQFPLTQAGLAGWRAAHDPDNRLELKLGEFTPRGHTIYGSLEVRGGDEDDGNVHTFDFHGADDTALAASLGNLLRFHLHRHVKLPAQQ